MSKPRKTTNWELELRPEEMLDKKSDSQVIRTVLLKGLRRLAEEAGIKSGRCEIINSGDMVQCIYTTCFDDGTSWPGAGDCSKNNTNKPYVNYPTSVAESRAEARSLRKALNIQMLSSEEIDLSESKSDITPNQQIDSSVVVAIEQLCDSKNCNKVDVVNSIISDKQRANSIFELKQLTIEEGQRAMSYLNSLPEKKRSKK